DLVLVARSPPSPQSSVGSGEDGIQERVFGHPGRSPGPVLVADEHFGETRFRWVEVGRVEVEVGGGEGQIGDTEWTEHGHGDVGAAGVDVWPGPSTVSPLGLHVHGDIQVPGWLIPDEKEVLADVMDPKDGEAPRVG